MKNSISHQGTKCPKKGENIIKRKGAERISRTNL